MYGEGVSNGSVWSSPGEAGTVAPQATALPQIDPHDRAVTAGLDRGAPRFLSPASPPGRVADAPEDGPPTCER